MASEKKELNQAITAYEANELYIQVLKKELKNAREKKNVLKDAIKKMKGKKVSKKKKKLFTDVNSLSGWIEFDDSQRNDSLKLLVSFMGKNGREYDISSKRNLGDVYLDGAKIEGDVKFSGVDRVFNEPEGGWSLKSFLEAIEIYQKEWRKKAENYFLDGYDYHHVIFNGMEKVDGVYSIGWDS